MEILAIANRKGGSGKTTVAVNLAAELAASGMRVLLADLDAQGHCALGLGLAPEDGAPTVHDLFGSAGATLGAAVRATPVPRLWLAPADTRFDPGSGPRDDERLRRALADEDMAARFDLVVLDTPPALGMLLANALRAASRVLVPVQPQPLALAGARQLMRTLFPVLARDNPGLRILGFLPVMENERVRLHRSIEAQMTGVFGAPRVLPGIRSDIRLAEAFAVGRPIRTYAPRSRGAADFARLGRWVAARLAVPGP